MGLTSGKWALKLVPILGDFPKNDWNAIKLVASNPFYNFPPKAFYKIYLKMTILV